MSKAQDRHAARRPGRRVLIAGAAGAAALAAVLASMASASSFTLSVERNAHVTNDPTKSFRVKPVNTHEAVVVGASGFAVYTFQGETTHHLICHKTSNPSTNCWAFWPPVSASSTKGLTAQKGVKGHLGTFQNHGTRQVTLNGQPLYYFTPDLQSGNKRQATGDELKTFGSIWHIVTAGSSAQRGAASTQPTMTTTTNTTSNPYPNYPGY
jgi:predicted lipoprotein with Yx(FWY)xxD motif